jgi:hypothetical protein
VGGLVVFLAAAVFGVVLFHIDARFIEDMQADLERERRLDELARRVRERGCPVSVVETRFPLTAVC